MRNESIMAWLNSRAIEDSYLYELLSESQIRYGDNLLGISKKAMNKKRFLDLLRFADILSRSEKAQNRNISLKIISLLYDEFKENKTFQLVSKSVLIKLGNFPSLSLIDSNCENNIFNFDIEIDKLIKNIFQGTSNKNKIFTDAQYKIFKELQGTNHYSFSASTSFGKSFLLTEYVKWIIDEGNASQNIAFLVPSRALISQVEEDLSKVIVGTRYKILTVPEIPDLYKHKKFIFVLTPERLIQYFSQRNPPISILIVDEAQKLVANDGRSPIFYHAISLAKQKSIKLFFASPNVPNPELFLNLVGNSTDEATQIIDMNVSRNLFYIDLQSLCIRQYLEYCNENVKERIFRCKNLFDTVSYLSKNRQSIIYCNSLSDTMAFADKFSEGVLQRNNKNLEELSDFIKDTIHERYGLAKMIRKGVSTHFGALPQVVRSKIEEEYRLGNIRYLFTTSTLLEGVNLPAKNIFILSEKIGRTKMSDLDFRNLIGRAGRLTKELSGNIFIVKLDNKKWQGSAIDLLNLDKLPILNSELLTGKDAFYKKIGQIINEEPLSKNTSLQKRHFLNEYASILSYQYKQNLDSILYRKLNEKNKNSQKILKVIEKYEVPSEILMTSVTISPVIQNKIYTSERPYIFPKDISYYTCREVLEQMFTIYNWGDNEHKNFLGKKNRLGYYATLMIDWITTKPLNVIIKSIIKYYSSNRLNITLDFNQNYILFDETNSQHLNHIVNQVMRDLETVVRFSIRNYITNYLQLTKQDESKWRDYLDYGTNESLVIELQKLGIDRQIAIEISKKAYKYFELNSENKLWKIRKEIKNDENLSTEAQDSILAVLKELEL